MVSLCRVFGSSWVCAYSEVCLHGRNRVGHPLLSVKAAGQGWLVGAHAQKLSPFQPPVLCFFSPYLSFSQVQYFAIFPCVSTFFGALI